MADDRLHRLTETDLENALRGLADAIAWPVAAPFEGGPDIAAAVRARIEAAGARPSPRRPWTWRPARRALVLAVAILLALAACQCATMATALG